MQIVNFSQRDYLSVISDLISILGGLGIVAFVIFTFSKKENTRKIKNNKSNKEARGKEKGLTLLGHRIIGTYTEGTITKWRVANKAETEREIKVNVKLKKNKKI